METNERFITVSELKQIVSEAAFLFREYPELVEYERTTDPVIKEHLVFLTNWDTNQYAEYFCSTKDLVKIPEEYRFAILSRLSFLLENLENHHHYQKIAMKSKDYEDFEDPLLFALNGIGSYPDSLNYYLPIS